MLNETQRREREETIYRAVLAQMAQGADLAALTVSRIAAAAGIGKGTVYEYFPSKQAIVAGLTRYCLQTELAQLAATLRPCTALEPAIAALCGHVREFAAHQGATYRILAQTVQRNHDILPRETATALAAALKTECTALFARLRQNGELAPELTDGCCFNAVMAACAMAAFRLMPCGGVCTQAEQQAALADMAVLLRRTLAPAK